MKPSMLKERMELMEIGDYLGFPRLGYGRDQSGRKRAILAGKQNWEKFCGHAHVTRIPTALRIGRVLRDNGVRVLASSMYSPTAGGAIGGVQVTVSVASTAAMGVPVDAMDKVLEAFEEPRRTLTNAEKQKRYRQRKKVSA